jgi:hypothetical protein
MPHLKKILMLVLLVLDQSPMQNLIETMHHYVVMCRFRPIDSWKQALEGYI